MRQHIIHWMQKYAPPWGFSGKIVKHTIFIFKVCCMKTTIQNQTKSGRYFGMLWPDLNKAVHDIWLSLFWLCQEHYKRSYSGANIKTERIPKTFRKFETRLRQWWRKTVHLQNRLEVKWAMKFGWRLANAKLRLKSWIYICNSIWYVQWVQRFATLNLKNNIRGANIKDIQKSWCSYKGKWLAYKLTASNGDDSFHNSFG